jgi:hypothetical protein
MTDVKTRILLESAGHKDVEKQIASLRKEQDRLSKEIRDRDWETNGER